jgi:hypothetical protein
VRLLTFVFFALALCLFLSNGVAWGDSVPIQNASFESTSPMFPAPCAGPGTCLFNFGSIPGWTTTGGETGSFEPSSAYFNLPLPDGNIVAFTNGGSISQTLTGISLLPNSIYTLSVDVGHRLDGLVTTYSISLDNGSSVFCNTGGSNGSVAAGTFADVILTCTTGASVPSGFLGIVLTGNGTQVDFDNVQLSVVSNSDPVNSDPTPVPEPSTLVLMLAGLGVVGLLFARSQRNQYLQSASS